MGHYLRIFPQSYGHALFNWPGIFVFLLVLWSIFWKGWALWDAARNKNKGWFIAILVINTVGVLEVVYLFFLSSNSQANRNRVKQLFSR